MPSIFLPKQWVLLIQPLIIKIVTYHLSFVKHESISLCVEQQHFFVVC